MLYNLDMTSKFSKTYLRIYLSMMFIVGLLLTATLATSGALLTRSLRSAFNNMATQKVERSLISGKNYINSVMLSAESIAMSNEFIAAMTVSNSPLTDKLDNYCNSAFSIDAVTVYSLNGIFTYSSSGINPPSFDELTADEEISDFIAMDGDELISLRTTAIAASYDNRPYNGECGVISCIKKLYSNSVPVGIVVADILPTAFYNYFSYDDTYTVYPVILYSDGAFWYSEVNDFLSEIDGRTGSVQNGNFSVINSTRNFYGGRLCAAVSLTPYRSIAASITLILTLSGYIIFFAAQLGSHYFAKIVTTRLDKLAERINSSTARFMS